MRLLPAAVIAPFASSLGDRFRRERFLLAVVLLGAAALVVSAAGAAAWTIAIIVFAAGSAVGVCSTLFRPALVALLPSLARTAMELIAANGATSTIESLGTLLGPLGAGVLVAFADVAAVFAASAAALLVSAALAGARVGPGSRPCALRATAGVDVWRGLQGNRRGPARAAPRGPHRLADVRARVPERADRRRRLPGAPQGRDGVGYLTAAIGAGGLVGALGAVSLRGERLAPPFAWALVFWGIPIMLIAPLPYPVRRDRPARGDRRREQRRRRRRVHAPPAHGSRRRADPRARRDLGPRDGHGRRSARSSRPRSSA